jgi:hypothetical protein
MTHLYFILPGALTQTLAGAHFANFSEIFKFLKIEFLPLTTSDVLSTIKDRFTN